MTKEEKELLLKDLCARLLYGVEVYYTETIPISMLKTINPEKGTCIVYDHSEWYRHTKLPIEVIKPYLRPMSSMTDEEWEDFNNYRGVDGVLMPIANELDWLNEYHFDYRGLIERGRALEAPEGMYK